MAEELLKTLKIFWIVILSLFCLLHSLNCKGAYLVQFYVYWLSSLMLVFSLQLPFTMISNIWLYLLLLKIIQVFFAINSCWTFVARILMEIFTISTSRLVRVYGTIHVMSSIERWLQGKGRNWPLVVGLFLPNVWGLIFSNAHWSFRIDHIKAHYNRSRSMFPHVACEWYTAYWVLHLPGNHLDQVCLASRPCDLNLIQVNSFKQLFSHGCNLPCA